MGEKVVKGKGSGRYYRERLENGNVIVWPRDVFEWLRQNDPEKFEEIRALKIEMAMKRGKITKSITFGVDQDMYDKIENYRTQKLMGFTRSEFMRYALEVGVKINGQLVVLNGTLKIEKEPIETAIELIENLCNLLGKLNGKNPLDDPNGKARKAVNYLKSLLPVAS